ncbi:hypothetical protein DMB41_20835 [Pectobacterium carotovorum subsp. carotovorum]|nr:hypothetical protein DMB41_20835 [Pectobacterium carotovorum subsp. carotovorum]
MDVIFLTFTAALSGASGWKAIQQFGECQLPWLRQHSPFANGIPKRHCIANIIKALCTAADRDRLEKVIPGVLVAERPVAIRQRHPAR